MPRACFSRTLFPSNLDRYSIRVVPSAVTAFKLKLFTPPVAGASFPILMQATRSLLFHLKHNLSTSITSSATLVSILTAECEKAAQSTRGHNTVHLPRFRFKSAPTLSPVHATIFRAHARIATAVAGTCFPADPEQAGITCTLIHGCTPQYTFTPILIPECMCVPTSIPQTGIDVRSMFARHSTLSLPYQYRNVCAFLHHKLISYALSMFAHQSTLLHPC